MGVHAFLNTFFRLTGTHFGDNLGCALDAGNASPGLRSRDTW